MSASCHMQAYAQYLPDKMKMKDACRVMSGSVSVCIFCCRTAAISAPFTPLSTFRFQPLPAVATHGIDVDITFHYVTSQFSAFSRLGVTRRSLALLGDIDACKSRRSQISALLAGFAALVALAGVGSHNVQQQLAQVAEPWGEPLHPHHNI